MTETSRRNTKSNDSTRRRIARPLAAAAIAVGLGAVGVCPAVAQPQGVAASAVSQTVLTAVPKAPAAAQQVAIKNFAFSPGTITVSKGTTVTWTNNDTDAHTVTSSGSSPLNSGTLAKGASYSYTFNTPGTFAYICSIHPFMHGTVVVQ
ncbi:cupredoxin family copper-binding protein [Kitasatospora sp. SUK 42]|uniref:cupredoxin domain-containing protein n=1 Tax=Kitasatospora sp. SUK 42 TaxID=1588882 RepID=UPI0018C92D2A|nr:cupredoxin family copper-binding protein [Kitasatospora sp. SUK 42]MBV2156655.1 cupredoxin family copper-binding protein [Kitasatospora sp. SUK 42]